MDRKSTSTLTGAVLLSFLLSLGLKSTPGEDGRARQNASHSQVGSDSTVNRTAAGSRYRALTIAGSRKRAVEEAAQKEYEDQLSKLIQVSCASRGNCERRPSEFVIALVPDPVHTHLALQFDRAIEVIEEALQDYGFIFDRAVMPWDQKTHPESDDYENRLEAEWNEKGKQEFPGLMLFRGGQERPNQWMFVLVVSETPTGGIRQKQFLNAVKQIHLAMHLDLRSGKEWPKDEPGLRIIGPTFSGSLASLEELLTCPSPNDPTHACNFGQNPVSIYSGTISSRTAILDFAKHEHDLNMRFMSFQESDEVMLERFIEFLTGKGYGTDKRKDLRHYLTRSIAVLSEDETAYGGSLNASTPASPKHEPPDCDSDEGDNDRYCSLKLTFPREISQLRAAYQDSLKGSISTDSRSKARDTLPSNFSVSGSDDDTVPAYSGKQMPLSQESIMLGIVSELHKHRIEYVILRATDPMDSLFLSEYLRAAFPQGRIVTIGADMLFRREADDPRLHGLLSLSTYSLEPSGNHYFASYEVQHVERIFPSSDAAGTYNAIYSSLAAPATDRLLAGRDCTQEQDEHETNCRHELVPSSSPPIRPIVPDKNLPLFLYQYGWLNEQCPTCDQLDRELRVSIKADCKYCAPPVRLLALGRDQYWPVASLGPFGPKERATQLPRIRRQMAGHVKQVEIPYSWQVVELAAVALGLYFTFSLWFSSVFSKTQALAKFAPAVPDFRGILILFAGQSLIFIMLILLWPSWHGAQGEWVVKYLLSVAVFTVFASTIIEWASRHFLADKPEPASDKNWNRFKQWLPLVVFVALSLVFAARVFLTPYSESSAFVLRFSILRAVQLTSGLSFIMPWFFFLTVWLWWADHITVGYALLDDRRPRLPQGMQDHRVTRLDERNFEEMSPTDLLGGSRNILCWAIPGGFIGGFWLLGDHYHPIMSLERPSLETYMSAFFALAVVGVIVATLSLWQMWIGTRKLLVALDAVPLRRGFQCLKGFSWKPIWRVGDGSLDEFQRIFSRKKEALDCAINTVPLYNVRVDQEMIATRVLSETTKKLRYGFAWHWWERRKAERKLVRQFCRVQTAMAEAAGAALDHLAWSWSVQKEQAGLLAEDRTGVDPQIRACERFVCLAYVDFLLVALIRIRTLIVAIGGMYVLTLVGVTQYPFEPKGAIQVMLFVLLAFVVVVVGAVFAQIHRDATLSNITDTTPGELGRDFWFRMAGFVALPVFSLLASEFPSVNRFFYSWLQPAIQALNR